jgi:hypothetical protein
MGAGLRRHFARRFSSATADNIAKQFVMSMARIASSKTHSKWVSLPYLNIQSSSGRSFMRDGGQKSTRKLYENSRVRMIYPD